MKAAIMSCRWGRDELAIIWGLRPWHVTYVIFVDDIVAVELVLGQKWAVLTPGSCHCKIIDGRLTMYRPSHGA